MSRDSLLSLSGLLESPGKDKEIQEDIDLDFLESKDAGEQINNIFKDEGETLHLEFDNIEDNDNQVQDLQEIDENDLLTKPGFDYKGIKIKEEKDSREWIDLKANIKPAQKMEEEEIDIDLNEVSVHNIEPSFSNKENSTMRKSESVQSIKPKFNIKKKILSKSESDGTLLFKNKLSKSQQAEALLKRVFAYIDSCKCGSFELLELFGMNTKGSLFFKELNLMIDEMVEKEKINLMHSGPFQKEITPKPLSVILNGLDRQHLEAEREIKIAEEDLLILEGEKHRVEDPLYLNQLISEIKETERLIAESATIIRLSKGGNKKEEAELDRILVGMEEDVHRRKKILYDLEREVDRARLQDEINSEEIIKHKEKIKQQEKELSQLTALIKKYEEKLRLIGLLDKDFLLEFSQANEEKTKLQKEIEIYSRNLSQKISIGNKDIDNIQAQNELLLLQLEQQEEVITQQLREIDRMTKERNIYIKEQALIKKREIELEAEMISQRLNTEDPPEDDELQNFIAEYESETNENHPLNDKVVDIAFENMWGNERQEKDAIKQDTKRTISIQANTINSEDFERMLIEDRKNNNIND